MLRINSQVKDGILEVIVGETQQSLKKYKITNQKGVVVLEGKITGQTQRTCLYIGDLKKGNYNFQLSDSEPIQFELI